MKMKMFCLPYAGASAMIYQSWKKQLAPTIELIPIEIAGRGLRMDEPFLSTFEEHVQDVYDVIVRQIGEEKFCIFGHSMGSLLAFELVHQLKDHEQPLPDHLFLSGCFPPHIREENRMKFKHMTEKEMFQEVVKLGGIPAELIENKEYKDLFFPIIKADLTMLDTYEYTHPKQKLSCHASIFYGKEDIQTDNPIKIGEWGEYFNKECHFYAFEGGHFFLNHEKAEVLKNVNRILEKVVLPQF
ncbi:thioesterase domain-containing protein [Mesobacillus maritimus]|uniref:thioesterase II family protein n=1 Tax=Mesobacillus maritimus TaxID=1643336 RepID=UPI00203A6705|nr:thioesterase domain-containing protein [Mesobacillus maritimus]MCM3670704.1 thioesterase domain-containing protein [Mesobacillus maritimus]